MRNLKRSTVVGTILALLLGAGVALAAWTSTGTGSGTATASDSKELIVTADDPTGLFPTGSVTVEVTIENPNPYKIALSSLEFVSATTAKAGCNASVVTGPASSAANDVIGADGGKVTKDVVVSMSNDAADACQDAVFTVNFRATGASSS